MATSEEPDESCRMWHALFDKTKLIVRERNTIYTMDHPDLTVPNFMEHSIGLKKDLKYDNFAAYGLLLYIKLTYFRMSFVIGTYHMTWCLKVK